MHASNIIGNFQPSTVGQNIYLVRCNKRKENKESHICNKWPHLDEQFIQPFDLKSKKVYRLIFLINRVQRKHCWIQTLTNIRYKSHKTNLFKGREGYPLRKVITTNFHQIFSAQRSQKFHINCLFHLHSNQYQWPNNTSSNPPYLPLATNHK